MIMDPAHSMNLRSMLLMLKSHNAGFETVVKMIENMVATNAKEQKDDDEKRDFCNAEILKTQDHEHALKGTISDLSADLEEKEDAVATLASEIKALQQGVADLDKSVVEATEQRKDEHAEFLSTSAANQAALELIKMATNRMNKFYQPSLYKAPPTTTVEDSPYGFVQIALHRAEPGAPPATFEGEYKKSEGSTGIISMMNQMAKDVEMDIQEGKHDEESAQKDYERAMKDAATKRSDDSKLMVEKNGAKADEQTNAQAVRSERATKRDQLNIAQDKLYDLHVDCNHVLTNYDESKANRAKEDDMLNQAKSVLAGASFN
jgi:septal ring factor EnvC (AmiA/AmiB activator)